MKDLDNMEDLEKIWEEETEGQNPLAVFYKKTPPPDAISDELRPVIDALGLEENCRQLVRDGWTVIENVRDDEFNARLRQTILDAGEPIENHFMLLGKDPIYAEAVLSPKILAMAEFSVGRGFLINQCASTVRPQGDPAIPLHVDNNWVPAPFPEYNLTVTGCWACDGFTKEGGSTVIVPGSNKLRRHPYEEELADAFERAIAIECPPGSVAMWDSNIWHSNAERTLEGDRVVMHMSFTRMCMRPMEDYSLHAERLIAEHGEPMAQLLGQRDSLYGPTGFDFGYMLDTVANSRT